MRRLFTTLAVAAATAATAATAGPPTVARSSFDWERLLGRPYAARTPMPGTGESLWVSHPRDWGFPDGVNYFQLDRLAAYRLALTADASPAAFGPCWAHPGHLACTALPPGDLALNTSLSGFPEANTSNGPKSFLLDGDSWPGSALWREAPGASGEIAISVDWAAPITLGSAIWHLVEDPARGLALPSAQRLEWHDGSRWQPVRETSRFPASPAAGANRVSFDPVTTTRIRVVLAARAAIGIVEIEAHAPGAALLELVEHKIVRPDDVLVSVIEAVNRGEAPATLAIEATSDLVAGTGPELVGAAVLHSIPVALRLDMGQGTITGNVARRDLVLAPGERRRTTIAMPFARSAAAARAKSEEVLAAVAPEQDAEAAMLDWLAGELPVLDTPEPWFEKMFAFRGALLRRALGDPRWGPIQHPAFREGSWDQPWYPQVITFGAPHQLREARWLRDGGLARGHALNLVENQRADGAFAGLQLTGAPGKEYVEWLGAAIADQFLVSGDTDLLARARAALVRNLEHTLGRDGDGDLLPVVADHFLTGMEWQPSFFYFSGFDAARPEPLERVEYATALAAGAGAAAQAARAACDEPEASRLGQLSLAVAAAIRDRMWDAGAGFFFPLREGDDAKALVREIAGFYPFAFGMAPPECDRAVAALFDPADFATPWGPASSSLACAATSEDGWPVGPGGSPSMWNGPTWPHATSIAVEAVARTIRRSGESIVTRAQLFAMLESYTRAQFEGAGAAKDFAQPMVGEDYRGDDGRWKTDERDYFHSTYLDLVIRFLVGLEPSALPEVRIDPLLPPGRWDHFLLERVRYRGHDLAVAWDEPGGVDHYGDGREGLDLWLDGELAAARPDLGPLAAELPAEVLLAAKQPPATGAPSFTLLPAGSPWSLWRSPARTLAAPASVTGDRILADTVADAAPPGAPLLFYRAGACGPGR